MNTDHKALADRLEDRLRDLWSYVQEARTTYAGDHSSSTFQRIGERIESILDTLTREPSTPSAQLPYAIIDHKSNSHELPLGRLSDGTNLYTTPSAQAGDVRGGAVIDLGDAGQLLNATVRGDVYVHAKFGDQVNGCCFIGRSVTDQRGIILTTPPPPVGEVFGYVHGGCFIRAENWTDQARPEGWTPVFTTPQPKGDASPQVSDEVLSLLRDMRAQLPPGSQDPITFMSKDNPLAARADRVIAELTRPVTMSNDGNSEADFIAHHADACPQCGGSGHEGDASGQVSGGGEVEQALMVVNDAANDARHRGDYQRANALVQARVTLYRAALSTPQARPDGVACGKCGVRQPFQHSPDCGKPAPTVDGGAVAGAVWVDDGVSLVQRGSEDRWCRDRNARRMYLTPAPAPDVARLVEACKAFERKFWQVAERHNDRTCDADVCQEVRDFRAALAPFTAAQQESQ